MSLTPTLEGIIVNDESKRAIAFDAAKDLANQFGNEYVAKVLYSNIEDNAAVYVGKYVPRKICGLTIGKRFEPCLSISPTDNWWLDHGKSKVSGEVQVVRSMSKNDYRKIAPVVNKLKGFYGTELPMIIELVESIKYTTSQY